MSKITKREFISNNFNILQNDLKNTGFFDSNINLFPDMDATDLTMFFRMYFDTIATKDVATITQLLDSQSTRICLDETQKTTVINIILPFIEIFRKVSS